MAPPGPHPLGNNDKFHGISPNPNASDLPRHESSPYWVTLEWKMDRRPDGRRAFARSGWRCCPVSLTQGRTALRCHCTRSGHGENRTDAGSIGTRHLPVTEKTGPIAAPFLALLSSSLPRFAASDEDCFAPQAARQAHRPITRPAFSASLTRFVVTTCITVTGTLGCGDPLHRKQYIRD